MGIFSIGPGRASSQREYYTKGYGRRGQGTPGTSSEAAHRSGSEREKQLNSWQNRERFSGSGEQGYDAHS